MFDCGFRIADCGFLNAECGMFQVRNGLNQSGVGSAWFGGFYVSPELGVRGQVLKKAHALFSVGLQKKIRAGRKPSSVSLIAQGDDHLSGPPVARRHERPTRKSRTGRPYPLAGDASLCGLAPGGVFQAPGFAAGPGGLLPHRFTLTLAGGLLFCGTVHGVAPCPVSGPPCPAELGLSSPRFRGAITSPALIV